MMKRKKKIGCCLNAGCFSGGGRRFRDDWSSELEYDKDYEKYRREYEKEYARLCELQRALTPNERSKRSETSTPINRSTFSRQFPGFDEHDDMSDEHVEHEIKKLTEGPGDEDSDSDAELLERWMKEDEEVEMLDKRRKHRKLEQGSQKSVSNEDLALKKRNDEEEFERKRREELAWKEREEVEIARKRRGEIARKAEEKARKEVEIARTNREELAKRRREGEEIARKEEEIARINREELAKRRREEEEIARKEEEIARINREELAKRRREEEEIARINREELAKRKREEEELASIKRQEEETARKQKEEEARRKWAEQELERQKKQKEEEDAQIRREELERQKKEQEEIERRKRLDEEDMRRRREEMARRKRQDEENARRKKMEEENLRRHKEEMLNRSREREEIERRRRLEEENLWRQKEERRKREEEENERRRRIEEEERRKKIEEEEIARRQREEEEARRKLEEEEIAKKKREEFALKEKEEQEIRRREEQARIAREHEEIERRKKEELARSKTQEEEDTGRRKKNEEQMEGWQTQDDSSWISLGDQAKNRDRGLSISDERIDRIQRADKLRHGVSPNANGSTTREIEDVKMGVMPKEGGYQNEWGEVEFLQEDEQGKSLKLIRNRTRRGKHVAGEDYDDGASASSSTSEVPSEEWDRGKPVNKHFSPLELVPGVKRQSDPQSEELLDTFQQRLFKAAKIPKENLQNRLNNPTAFLYGIMGVVLLISLFVFYLSFIARMKPPSECLNERIILNFSTTRIRLRGGRYLAFREQGVAAHRAEHSVVVVHDLLSSRLAGIPGINQTLLEEYKVRLISYDRPGYGQSDPHPGRNYNTSAYDIVEIADALNLGEKFWVVGFGGGGPHVWAAINYLPERLAGVALFAPAGNPYVRGMNREEIEETWGVLTPRQKWLHTIARRFPVLLPPLLQKAAITDGTDVPTNVRLSLGQKDQTWMDQPHVNKAWQEDVKEALRHRCAFALAEELSMLVSDWGFRLSELPFTERPATIFREMVASLFGREKKPKIFEGPIHIWQGTDDQMVPVAMNNVAKRLVEQNKLLNFEEKSSPVKIHYLPGEGHFSWFWFCDECHRRIFQALFRPNEALEAEEEPLPSSPKGFSKEDYEAIVTAFEALKMPPETYTGKKTVENSATTKEREEELQKVLRTVLRNKRIEEEYLRQQSEAAGKKGGFSTSRKPSEEMIEVHPMTCRATNDALRDQSVVYVCPDDDDDLPEQSDSAHQGLDRVRKSKAARKGDNSREIKNKTGTSRSTYLEGLSTLVKRLARHRK
ncbi:hypothetical protein R1sor_007016 [Riccia sorocarpa]|uniref:AB hydrolase-1 domain-containing protein n=1 Tax=Riccia sorocarpa TaxID=122646 RepID=A0ABD3HTF8_9MARC